MNNFKHIHIGSHIERLVKIKQLSVTRMCLYFNCSVKEIEDMYIQESLDSKILLKWCKLLEYNLFMFYHSHLQIYSPKSTNTKVVIEDAQREKKEEDLFRKNLYSNELKMWILEKWDNEELTASEIIKKYHIPKTTLYRWRRKEVSLSKTSVKKVSSKKKVNYKRLYIDFIKGNVQISKPIKNKLIEVIKGWPDGYVSYKRIYDLNNKLESCYQQNSEKNVRLRSYDKNIIIQVLKEQKEYGLSDLSICLKYKLSRNTISRWKKTFNSSF